MLGWLIIVRKAVPAEPEGIDSPSVLATWESSTGRGGAPRISGGVGLIQEH